MAMNGFGSASRRYDDEVVVIGLFSYASDARRALHILHEQEFTSDQIIAAFREPAGSRTGSDGGSVPIRASGRWFGQLRQIYRGDERAEGWPEATTMGFEAMLAQIDLAPQDAQMLNRDLDRGAAIVMVKAGTRGEEARALLKQRGASIVHGRHDREWSRPTEAKPAIVNSTPFTAPQEAAPDHIRLFGEVLRVRKEKVSSGDVHVRKEAVTRTETLEVPVTREELVVEHTDENGREEAEHAIRVPLSEERVYIDKDTVLREEYKVGKRDVTQNESVADTVRRERLLIDEAGTRTED
jgi:uncharacterized protein (TIGR02271 family)